MPSPARAIACCAAAVIVALVAAVPAAARPSTRGERVAAATAFASRTLTFERQQRAARPSAVRALATRREAAQGCLPVWQAAPLRLRGELGLIYFEYLSGGLWSVDAPLFQSWIYDVRRSARIGRSAVLDRAADALGRDFAVANRIYRAVPDACARVTMWRDAGWSPAARPSVLAVIDELPREPDPGREALLDSARRQLVRYARRGKAAAKLLVDGVDEPDSLVNAHTGCDAIGALVLPDAYPACVPAP